MVVPLFSLGKLYPCSINLKPRYRNRWYPCSISWRWSQDTSICGKINMLWICLYAFVWSIDSFGTLNLIYICDLTDWAMLYDHDNSSLSHMTWIHRPCTHQKALLNWVRMSMSTHTIQHCPNSIKLAISIWLNLHE